MKPSQILFGLLAFILWTFDASGQTTPADTLPKPKIKLDKYFDDGQGGEDAPRTLVKINPLLLVVGEAPVYIEKRLSNKFSIEGAAGITFRSVFNNIGLIYESAAEEILISRIQQPSVTGKLSMRYYPKGELYFPQGNYFGLQGRYRQYRYQLQYYLYPSSSESLTSQVQITDYDFLIINGFQEVFRGAFYYDIYYGLGVRYKQGNRLRFQDKTGKYEVVSGGDLNPLVAAGIKIGYAF